MCMLGLDFGTNRVERMIHLTKRFLVAYASLNVAGSKDCSG